MCVPMRVQDLEHGGDNGLCGLLGPKVSRVRTHLTVVEAPRAQEPKGFEGCRGPSWLLSYWQLH